MTLARYAFETLIPEHQQAAMDIAMMQASAAEDIAPSAPPPPPSFTEAEMQAARSASYEEGFMAGKAEGKREIDAQALQLQQETQQVSALVSQRLEGLATQHQQYVIDKQAELGRLVLACAQKIAVEALRKEPLADIQKMVEECLALLLEEPKVTLQVHPKLQSQLATLFAGRVRVTANAEVKPLDCIMNWQHGEATREIDEIWNQIEETITRYFTISANNMQNQQNTPAQAYQQENNSEAESESDASLPEINLQNLTEE